MALKASIAILDRVGIGANRTVSISHKHELATYSDEELRERFRQGIAALSPVERQQLEAAGITLAALPAPAEPPIDAAYVEVDPKKAMRARYLGRHQETRENAQYEFAQSA